MSEPVVIASRSVCCHNLIMFGPHLISGKKEASMKVASTCLVLATLALNLIGCAGTQTVKGRDMQLIRAAERGETKEVYRLIAAGANVNARDEEGWTPYLAASTMGRLDAMRVLRAFGAKTEAPDMTTENVAHRMLADR